MSGGYFDYRNDSLCNEMFRYCAEPVYGMGEDMNYFRQKWLKKAPAEFVKTQIESSINELREELYRSLAVGETE